MTPIAKQNQGCRRLSLREFPCSTKDHSCFPAHSLLWHCAPQHFISERRQLRPNTNVRRVVKNNLEANSCQLQSNYDLSQNLILLCSVFAHETLQGVLSLACAWDTLRRPVASQVLAPVFSRGQPSALSAKRRGNTSAAVRAVHSSARLELASGDSGMCVIY